MPTQDEIVTVPLHATVNTKADEFTVEAPSLRLAENVSNEDTLGGVRRSPDFLASNNTGINNGLAPFGMLTGNQQLAFLDERGRVFPYLKGDTFGFRRGNPVPPRIHNREVRGTHVISAPDMVTSLSQGRFTTDEGIQVDVFVWAQNYGVAQREVYCLYRHGDQNFGPFPIANASGKTILSVCAASRTDTTVAQRGAFFVAYVDGLGNANVVEMYSLGPSGPELRNSLSLAISSALALDVVQDEAQGEADWLLSVANNGAPLAVYACNSESNPFPMTLVVSGGANTNGRGVAIDSGAGGLLVRTVAGATGPNTIQALQFLTTDPPGTLVNSAIATPAEPSRCTLRYFDADSQQDTGALRFWGAYDIRKFEGVTNVQPEQVGLLDYSGPNLAAVSPFEIPYMRLAGDIFVDDFNNGIVPLTRTRANSAGVQFTFAPEAVWPSDPAIVGYQLSFTSGAASDVVPLHPMLQFGTDRVRSDFGRTKAAFVYAADPITADQPFGRSIQVVDARVRHTLASQKLGTGGELLAGGVAQLYDGRLGLPVCHSWRPEISLVNGLGGGSGGTPAGDYRLKAVFVWRDDTGQLIRSADSEEVQVTSAAGEAFTIRISCHLPPQGSMDDDYPIQAWIYSTETNGEDFYLLTGAGPPTDQGPVVFSGYTVANGYMQRTVSSLEANPADPLLPFTTTPPEVAPRSPNGFHHVVAVRDRVWGIDAEDRNRVWFSKRMSRFSPPEFNSQFVVDFPEEDGGLEAIGVINGNPVFFKRTSYWVLQGGEGPDNIVGLGAPFALPIKLGFVGTPNYRSVETYPEGVVFHTGRALMVLGNNLLAAPFGLEVQPDFSDRFITGLANIPTRRELHFSVGASEDAIADTHWVYNYESARWSTWTDLPNFYDVHPIAGSWIFSYYESDVFSWIFAQLRDVGADPDFAGAGLNIYTPNIRLVTAWIRPGDRAAARKVREVLVEFRRDPGGDSGSGNVDMVITSEHDLAQHVVDWTGTEIDAAYPSGERIVLRAVPTKQLESVQLDLTVDYRMNLRPISATVIFGIEPGAQRRYPEGASK